MMQERMRLRLSFYTSIAIAGVGSLVMQIYIKLSEYSNPYFYAGLIMLIVGVIFSIKDGRKFFRNLEGQNKCIHNETWIREDNRKICSRCGAEL